MQVVSLSISSLDKSGENLLEGYLGGILNANSSAQFQKSPFTMIRVTRRSRSDSRYLLTYSLTHLLSVSTDLTDVTLVGDDTY